MLVFKELYTINTPLTRLVNSTKHVKKNNTNPPQTIPKNIRGGNTSKLILWVQNYPDTKVRQGHYKKRKLQANISDEYRCKNPQENISKLGVSEVWASDWQQRRQQQWAGLSSLAESCRSVSVPVSWRPEGRQDDSGSGCLFCEPCHPSVLSEASDPVSPDGNLCPKLYPDFSQ